jgi:hypothetical protein
MRRFFFPPSGSPRWIIVLPYIVLGVLAIALFVGGTYGWEYTNSPRFCGTTCHTMPPENAAYVVSPHAQVYCTECHIGRSVLGQQVARKTQDVRELTSMIFHTYQFPIRASQTRPARETCEKCHQPEAFTGDKLLVINHFQTDRNNTPSSLYLIMKTGGGTKRQGLGLGIHWHTINKVEYYTTDPLSQTIPFVRVHNEDGTTTDYVDTESGIDPARIDPSQLKTVDCVTCHNRVTHNFQPPADSVDSAMARGLITTDIPYIRSKAVEVLSAKFTNHTEAVAAITGIGQYYRNNYSDYSFDNPDKIKAAVQAIQDIYDRTVFVDQSVDWTTYPNNIGHINTPGCFRCHDGKHLNNQHAAIRLECNLCHSIPVVASAQDFVTKIEISRGPEPSSHLNPNWINLHHDAFDASCANCHTTGDAGGTSNTSFCSNSACHATVFTYAGFDAPSLRTILQSQLPPPTPAPTLAPVVGTPTYDANVQPVFSAQCVACHNAPTLTGGLDLSTYASAMQGGKDGAVITPGDSAQSLLVQIQSKKHFANLSPDELALVKAWIEAGAPEK